MAGPAYIDSFRLIRVLPDDVTIAADAVDDTLTLAAGPGISLVVNAGSDQITIVNTNPAEFSFGVAGDDSSIKTISSGETIRFAGVGPIDVAADSEGAISISWDENAIDWAGIVGPSIQANGLPVGAYGRDLSLESLTVDSVAIDTNVIQTVDSNANLELRASGTGAVSVIGNLLVSSNVIGNVIGYQIGDMTGSVFGDDSSILVDAVANKIYASSITVNSTGGLGYSTGAGGAVTQTGSRGNGVSLNKLTGEITLVSGSIAAGGVDAFLCGNNLIESTDVVYAQVTSYNPGVYLVVPQAVTSPFPGIFFYLRNIDSFASPNEVVTIRFVVVKSTNS